MGLALSGVCELAQTVFPSASAFTVEEHRGGKSLQSVEEQQGSQREQETTLRVLLKRQMLQHQRLWPDDATAARV